MEKKKEIVLQILDRLKWYWNRADELIVMVNSVYCTDEVLDSLINFINDAVKSAKQNEEKQALQKSMIQLQKIKELEEKEKYSDEELDSILDNIE